MIKIDQRSNQSAYIELGGITLYVEHSQGCAEEYVSVWDSCTGESIFESSWDFEKNNRHCEVYQEQEVS